MNDITPDEREIQKALGTLLILNVITTGGLISIPFKDKSEYLNAYVRIRRIVCSSTTSAAHYAERFGDILLRTDCIIGMFNKEENI